MRELFATVWAIGAADALIGLSFFAIAVSLQRLASRTNLPFRRAAVSCGIFLAACGLGNLVEIWTLWNPGDSWLIAVRFLTAGAAVAAAASLIPALPGVIRAVRGLYLSETRRKMLEDYADELRSVNHLREREAKDFEAILSSSTDQIYRLTLDGLFVYTSPAVSRAFGKNPLEFRGRSWRDLGLAEETLHQLEEAKREIIEGVAEAGGRIAFPIQGAARHFDFIFSPIFSEGRLVGITANFRDTTERKSYEDALRRAYEEMEHRVRERTAELSTSHRKYQDLMNTIDGVVWEAEVGKPGFVFVSRQAERIIGYPIEKWLKEPRFWQKILHPEDLGKITGDRYVQAEQKKDSQVEYRLITAENRVLWVKDYIRVIQEPGEPQKMRGVMVDITERKRVEQDLILAQAASERAAAVKAEFLANMSHEIRTPLNAIIGMTSLGLDYEMSTEMRDCFATINVAADSLLLLVNDILDFSKLEAGKVELEITDFSLPLLCRHAVNLLGAPARNKNIELSWEAKGQLPVSLSGDRGRILQVLLNLLGNAVKFTPDSGKISLSAENIAAGATPRIRFEVRDTGIGIAPEVMERLFHPFSQADSSTARKYGGTGLGLSICRRITELMGGAVGATSQPGAGSCFWVEIPLLPGVQSPLTLVPLPRQRCGDGKKKSDWRILVADDNPANQKVALRLLEKLGYRADAVSEGNQAIARIKSGGYDLVLMDCQMPELDGYDATREIRKLPQGREIPIIALTAHALKGDEKKCRDAGMDDYLTKPITLNSLALALEKWLAAETPEARIPALVSPLAAARPLLDEKYLASLEELNGEGKSDIIVELGEYFLSCSAGKIDQILAAFSHNDFPALEKIAHSFKSTCHNIGARGLAALCEELENAAKKKPSISEQQVRREFAAVRSAVQALVESRSKVKTAA